MPLPTNISSYEDLRTHLDQAMSSERGIKVFYATHGEAVYQLSRFNKFRVLDRENSTEIYDPGDARRGVSVYDRLKMTVPKEGAWVEITKKAPIRVEEL